MTNKRIYRTIDVNQISLAKLQELAIKKGGKGTSVGLRRWQK